MEDLADREGEHAESLGQLGVARVVDVDGGEGDGRVGAGEEGGGGIQLGGELKAARAPVRRTGGEEVSKREVSRREVRRGEVSRREVRRQERWYEADSMHGGRYREMSCTHQRVVKASSTRECLASSCSNPGVASIS